jgi:hypothetical protein
MVKKRVKRMASRKHKGHKLFIITIVMAFVLALAVNHVNTGVTGYATTPTAAPSSSGGYLTDILMGNGTLDEVFLRWTLFGMFSVLLFSMFSAFTWPKNFFLKWMLALPIAFISISFVSRTDLITSLTSYGALALTFVSVIPLAIMFFFSAMLLQGRTNLLKIIGQFLGWYYYMAFDLYILVKLAVNKFPALGFNPGSLSWWNTLLSSGGIPILIILAGGLVAVLVVIFNQRFRRWIRNIGRELIQEVQHDQAVISGAAGTNP